MDDYPHAHVSGKKRFSIIWLIPILALLIGAWLTFTFWMEKGPVVTIVFESAEGLVAGKTKIRHKDIEVGVVDKIAFNSDLSKVLVTATLDTEMGKFLNGKTQFWVVRARLSVNEVKALNTLLSGAYIGMKPGDGKSRVRKFVGMETPPVLFQDDPGSRYTLRSTLLHSYDIGTPVYFRHMKVGEVIDYRLDDDGKEFSIEIFVHAPYDSFVRENTLFWNAGGLDVKIGADGVQVKSESLVTILLGGLAFGNLEGVPGKLAQPGSSFRLHDSKSSAEVREYAEKTSYRFYFGSSAKGLNPGAPVTLRGIKVGEVTDVKLIFDRDDATFKIPVTVEIESERITVIGGNEGDEPDTALLVSHGLRAQLRSGSLLTGQMLIDLDMYPDAKEASIREEDGYLVLPTIPGSIDALKQNLGNLLEKINRIPLDEISVNLNGVISGANELVQSLNGIANSEEVSSTLTGISNSVGLLESTMKQVDGLVGSSEIDKMLENINSAVLQLDATLKEGETMAASFGEDSGIYQSALDVMSDLSLAIRSLRQMAEYLERHPEALLKGKTR